MRALFWIRTVLCGWLALLGAKAWATDTIDILILYTDGVREYYSDHDGVVSHALNAVESANVGFANSGLDVELRLAHIVATDYVESVVSYDEDLDRLRGRGDGFMDDVHALRDAWGADLVVLFRKGSLNGKAGLADLLNYEDGLDSAAFSVVQAESAISNLTFHHEIGHNFGGGHARGDTGNGGLFDYSNGYRFFGNNSVQYRTTMAYTPGTRINQYSSPDIQHQGVATGKADGDPASADNVSTFQITAPYLAAYRQHMPTIPEFLGVTPNMTVATGASMYLTVNAVGAPDLSLQWYEGTSGDETNPIVGATSSQIETGPLTETTYYWVKATNPNGSSNSPTIAVSVTPLPPNATTVDQSQPTVATAYILQWDRTSEGYIYDPYWQEFVPSLSYTDAIEVALWKGSGGNPSGVARAQLYDPNGYLIYQQDISGSELNANSPKWIPLPIKMYLTPGETYRLMIFATEPLNPGADQVFVWGTHLNYGNPYTAAHSNLDFSPSFNTEPGFQGIDFAFRTKGSDASPLFVSIDPESSSVGAAAGNYQIAVSSNTAWTVTESLDWVTTSPSSGSDNGSVTINYTVNPSAMERSGTITIGGMDHSITQAGASAFVNIDIDSKSVSSSGGSYEVAVTSNTDWSVSESLDWVTVDPASGSGDGTVTVTYLANGDTVSRNGAISIGGNAHTITQAGAALVVEIDPATQRVDMSGGSYDIAVSSNGAWTLSENAEWVTLSKSSGSGNDSVSVTVSANDGAFSRSATIASEDGVHVVTQMGVPAQGSTFEDWLRAYYSDTEIAAMQPSPAEADSDGDGTPNGMEFSFGLNPVRPSALIEVGAALDGEQIEVTFAPYDPNVEYQIYKSATLQAWTQVAAEITPGDGDAVARFDLESGVYYRVYGQPK